MKPIFFILSLFYFTNSLFCQTIPPRQPNNIINEKKQGNWVYWYNAQWKATAIKDSVAFYRKITFKDDKPIGIVNDFYKSGQKQWEGQLISVEPETKEGKCTWYYENGNKEVTGFYQNGERNGQWIWYKEDGTIDSENDYKIKSEAEKQWIAKNKQLLKLYNEGNYTEAIEIGEVNVAFAKKALGENHPSYATSLNNLADLYKSQGQYDKALPLYLQAMEIRIKALGENHPDYASSLNNLALLYASQGQYDKALPLYLQAMEIRKKTLGENHPDYASSLNNLAGLYKSQGQYDKALPLYLQAMEIRKKALGENHPDYASSLNNLASLYESQGQYDKALPLCLQASEIYKKALGENHPNYALSLNNLALLYISQGQYDKAVPLYLQAMEIRKKALGESHPDYATSINNLAALYQSQGQYDEAVPLYLQASEISKKALGENHPDYASSLNNLALLYASQGQYDKALPLYLQAMEIRKKTLGENHPNYASSLNNLASLYESQGQYDKAVPLYLQAMEIRKKALGENHPDYASSLNNLASLYKSQGQYDKAVPLYLQASEIYKKALGENHPDYASSLNNLASLYESQGQYDKALPLYLQAMEIRKKALGENHPDYASSLNNLASLYKSQGQYDKAVPLYLQASEIYKKALGENHPYYASSLNNLASLYESQGQYDKALPLYNVAIKILQFQISKSKTYLPEKDLQLFFSMNEYLTKIHASFALAHPDTSIINSCYNTTLLLKGAGLQNISLLQNSIAASTNESLKEKYNQFIDLRKTLAFLEQQPISKRQGWDSLNAKANETEATLMRLSPEFQQQNKLGAVNWQQIQQQLKENEVAIEMVNFGFYDKRWTDSVYYAAYIIRKGWQSPKLIKLFEKKQLDSLFTGKSSAAETSTLYASRGIEFNNRNNKKYALALYNLIWQPMLPYLDKATTIYISPTGLLYTISFNAIPTPDSMQLLDKYNIHILSCTRNIADERFSEKGLLNSCQLYGGIDYDNPATTAAPSHADAFADMVLGIKKEAASRNATTAKYEYLNGTEVEVTKIAALLTTNGSSNKANMRTNASEEAFKLMGNQTTKSAILHIATHGFAFASAKKDKPKDNFNLEKVTYTAADNPLLRTGLLMAGANKAWVDGIPYPNKEDGILTALEISNVDLKGCKLAVLSACETGLGDIKGSEGVYGLQRAFKMAGVQNLIVSLWSIDDAKTQEFMIDFYTQLLITNHIVNSFKQTQLKMRAKYKNPFYWAGFVLIE